MKVSASFSCWTLPLREFCFGVPGRVELFVAVGGGRIVGYATCMFQFSPWIGRHVEIENRSAQKFYRELGAELRDKCVAYWSTESVEAHLAVTSRESAASPPRPSPASRSRRKL